MIEPRPEPLPPDPRDAAPSPASNDNGPEAAREGTAPVASREEQMARFEDALKEEDWGHQPC